MTEEEEMLVEKWCGASFDQYLVNERARARDICPELNRTRPGATSKRKELIDQLFQIVIDNVSTSIPFDTDYDWNVRLGKNAYANTDCYFMDDGQITIGDSVFIGPSCGFYTTIHPLNFHYKNEGFGKAGPIHIGSNTWFDDHVAMLLGVTAGKDSVIGAGSTVTKDIPPRNLAVRNPCEVIRKINNDLPSETLSDKTIK